MKLLNYITITTLVLFLAACGGGGSSTTESESSQIVIIQDLDFPKIPLGTSTDNFKYAWSINDTTLNATYVSNYSIDSNAHIHMPTATNNQKIKVAIIDQGFEYRHPDIYDKIIESKSVQITNLTEEFPPPACTRSNLSPAYFEIRTKAFNSFI